MFGQLGSADFGRDPKVFQTPSAWWVPATRCYADFGKRDTRDMQSAGLREALLLAASPNSAISPDLDTPSATCDHFPKRVSLHTIATRKPISSNSPVTILPSVSFANSSVASIRFLSFKFRTRPQVYLRFGSGTWRSRHIFRARNSLISRCRGTAVDVSAARLT